MEKFPLAPGEEAVFLALTPEDVTFLFFYLGLAVSRSLTIDELNVMANGLFLAAQVLFTISAQRELLNDFLDEQQKQSEKKEQQAEKPAQEDHQPRETAALQIRMLQAQIEKLEKQVAELAAAR